MKNCLVSIIDNFLRCYESPTGPRHKCRFAEHLTRDAVYFGQQYGQVSSKVEHMRIPEGMINMRDGFLVGVLWQGLLSCVLLLVDGALPLMQFFLDSSMANFQVTLSR